MAVEVISLRAIPPPCPQNAPSPPSTLRSSSPASQSAISPSPSSSSPSSPSPSSPNTPAVPPRTTTNQPISPERFALGCEAFKQKFQSLPKGTQGVVAVVGDGPLAHGETDRTCGHSKFKEIAIKGEFLGLVYQALGNVDVRFHFGEGAGAGVSRKDFHGGFIASNPLSNLIRFFKNLVPSSQRHHSVFKRTVHLKTLLDPISFEDRNKVVHDITFADMDDFLTTLRYSERGPEAAVYEMVCAAITGVPYSDGWQHDHNLISTAASKVRAQDIVSLDQDPLATEEQKKNRRMYIQLRHAAAQFERTRQAVAVQVNEKNLAEGWVKTDRIAVIEGNLDAIESKLKAIERKLKAIESNLKVHTVFIASIGLFLLYSAIRPTANTR